MLRTLIGLLLLLVVGGLGFYLGRSSAPVIAISPMPSTQVTGVEADADRPAAGRGDVRADRPGAGRRAGRHH